ncbi:uncharacterized protein LOC109718671 [Ananas comosus]|uniref:Uncharacterized protein LOC109718671 n=1 Tax=Ananas comosus TaxID=4615 RepID=A0A6P5FWA9_ANACO|nr:uncharacterized protein LOC109718671 [Ananas comosus]
MRPHHPNRVANIAEPTSAGCCAPLLRHRRRPGRRPSRRSYLPLADAAAASPAPTMAVVVVGKERRVFHVDPSVLEKEPVRALMDAAAAAAKTKRGRSKGGVVFVDADAILFEHALWMAHNERSSPSSSSSSSSSAVSPVSASLFKLHLRDIIEFYSQE